MKRPILFSGNANPDLAKRIAKNLNVRLGDIYHHQFPSGEWYCQLKENVRGADVFLIQGIIEPANENLMQLLIMADACRRASAERITVIIPYMGYSRQDRKDKSRVPISAKLVMDILAAAGINRIVTMDLHAPQIAGFTNLPFDHLLFRPVLIQALKQEDIDVVVAPDIGAVKKAEEYSKRLSIPLALIAKQRKNDTEVEVSQFVGDVKGRNVLIVDDLSESMGTLAQAAKLCKENGARRVVVAMSHYCLTTLGEDRLRKSITDKVIDKMYCSNTTDEIVGSERPLVYRKFLEVVDVAPLFAKAIKSIHTNKSISALFD